MYTHENFASDVTKNFEFLTSDYGMRREPMHVAGVTCWIAYASPSAKVIVEYEIGGYCSLSVQDLTHVKSDPLERSEFDLDEILAVNGVRQQRRPEPRTASEAVTRAAETLRTAGAAVLRGEFEALHSRQRKVVEAVRRFNPTAV